MSKTQQVAFTVSGEWLADFARTRLEEGRWDAGLNTLVDSLEGLTHDQAIAILKGEATLEGDSNTGIDIVSLPAGNDIAQRISERLDYMYGDLFRHGDQIWRPYAVVFGWCAEDWHFSQKVGKHRATINVHEDKPGAMRSLFYANDQDSDLLVRTNKLFDLDAYSAVNDVLCEKFTGTIPFWYRLSTDVVPFVESVIEKRGFKGWKGIDVRGAFDAVSHDREAAPVTTIEAIADDVSKLLIADVDVDDPTVRGTAQAALQQMFELLENFFAATPTDRDVVHNTDVEFESVIDTLHKHISLEQWTLVDKYRKLFNEHQERILSEQILTQAATLGGFIKLELFTYDDKHQKIPYNPPSVQVPKNPFLHWAMRGFNWEDHGHEHPEWKIIGGQGLKMFGDDPYHTDWVLGAKVPLDQVYDHDGLSFGAVVMSSAYAARSEIVEQYTQHQFVTLCKGDQRIFSGDIVHPEPNERVASGSIVVVPHAGPEYQLAMETANGIDPTTGRRGCIICDTGGRLAHLAIVGREFKCTVLMMPNATKMYREGDRVWLNLDDGTITNSGV